MDLQGSSGGSLQGGGVNLQGPGAPSYVRPNGAFWQGADGNVYVAGAAGTHSAGAFDSNTANYWGSRGYTQQADPNAPKVASNGTGSGGSNLAASNITSAAAKGPVAADKSGDITVQNAGLAAADGNYNTGINHINDALTTLKGGYDTEAKTNETNYTNESNSNLNALQAGKQTSLVNAAQGRHGLLGTLASIGALSGDSINLANQAVQEGANADLTGVTHTFSTNQSGLDTSIGTFRQEDKTRRDNADVAAGNARQNELSKNDQSKQNFLKNLADDYTAQLNPAKAKEYSDKIAALYPEIAANNVPAAPLQAQSAVYTPGALSTYIGNNNTAVNTSAASGSAPGSLPGLQALSGSATRKQDNVSTVIR
jgi:hypothetical protein